MRCSEFHPQPIAPCDRRLQRLDLPEIDALTHHDPLLVSCSPTYKSIHRTRFIAKRILNKGLIRSEKLRRSIKAGWRCAACADWSCESHFTARPREGGDPGAARRSLRASGPGFPACAGMSGRDAEW